MFVTILCKLFKQIFKFKNGEQTEIIPTLEQTLELTQIELPKKYNTKPFKLMIEIKSCHDYKLMAQQVSDLFQKYDLYDKAVVGSFFSNAFISLSRS